MFCTEHGRKDKKFNGRMYKPFPRDHPEWMSAKRKKQAAWKGNRNKAKANGKHKAPDADPDFDASPTKVSISKIFKDALTSKVHLSDQ